MRRRKSSLAAAEVAGEQDANATPTGEEVASAGEESTTTPLSSSALKPVEVLVRVRPQVSQHKATVISVSGDKETLVVQLTSQRKRKFRLPHIAQGKAAEGKCESLFRVLVDAVLQGGDAVVTSTGIPGAGKRYTLFGDPNSKRSRVGMLAGFLRRLHAAHGDEVCPCMLRVVAVRDTAQNLLVDKRQQAESILGRQGRIFTTADELFKALYGALSKQAIVKGRAGRHVVVSVEVRAPALLAKARGAGGGGGSDDRRSRGPTLVFVEVGDTDSSALQECMDALAQGAPQPVPAERSGLTKEIKEYLVHGTPALVVGCVRDDSADSQTVATLEDLQRCGQARGTRWEAVGGTDDDGDDNDDASEATPVELEGYVGQRTGRHHLCVRLRGGDDACEGGSAARVWAVSATECRLEVQRVWRNAPRRERGEDARDTHDTELKSYVVSRLFTPETSQEAVAREARAWWASLPPDAPFLALTAGCGASGAAYTMFGEPGVEDACIVRAALDVLCRDATGAGAPPLAITIKAVGVHRTRMVDLLTTANGSLAADVAENPLTLPPGERPGARKKGARSPRAVKAPRKLSLDDVGGLSEATAHTADDALRHIQTACVTTKREQRVPPGTPGPSSVDTLVQVRVGGRTGCFARVRNDAAHLLLKTAARATSRRRPLPTHDADTQVVSLMRGYAEGDGAILTMACARAGDPVQVPAMGGLLENLETQLDIAKQGVQAHPVDDTGAPVLPGIQAAGPGAASSPCDDVSIVLHSASAELGMRVFRALVGRHAQKQEPGLTYARIPPTALGFPDDGERDTLNVVYLQTCAADAIAAMRRLVYAAPGARALFVACVPPPTEGDDDTAAAVANEGVVVNPELHGDHATHVAVLYCTEAVEAWPRPAFYRMSEGAAGAEGTTRDKRLGQTEAWVTQQRVEAAAALLENDSSPVPPTLRRQIRYRSVRVGDVASLRARVREAVDIFVSNADVEAYAARRFVLVRTPFGDVEVHGAADTTTPRDLLHQALAAQGQSLRTGIEGRAWLLLADARISSPEDDVRAQETAADVRAPPFRAVLIEMMRKGDCVEGYLNGTVMVTAMKVTQIRDVNVLLAPIHDFDDDAQNTPYWHPVAGLRPAPHGQRDSLLRHVCKANTNPHGPGGEDFSWMLYLTQQRLRAAPKACFDDYDAYGAAD